MELIYEDQNEIYNKKFSNIIYNWENNEDDLLILISILSKRGELESLHYLYRRCYNYKNLNYAIMFHAIKHNNNKLFLWFADNTPKLTEEEYNSLFGTAMCSNNETIMEYLIINHANLKMLENLIIFDSLFKLFKKLHNHILKYKEQIIEYSKKHEKYNILKIIT